MDGATAQVSYDGGSTWDTSPTVELPDFYSYEEFACGSCSYLYLSSIEFASTSVIFPDLV